MESVGIQHLKTIKEFEDFQFMEMMDGITKEILLEMLEEGSIDFNL